MGFFKLGKLDKGAEKDKEKKRTQSHDEPPAVGGGSGPSVNDFISKTKSRQKQGLKPSGPELIAYARYLGIDPVVDHDLLWIAEEALAAPLPSEWTEHFDSSDRVFYYNATTHVSTWTHPLEHVYRETYRTIVDFRSSSMSPAERAEHLHKLQAECHQMEREVHTEITAWTEHTDEQGHRFYFNRVKGKSSWTDPRPAKCHILYLKMKMIRILCQQAGVNFNDERLMSRFQPLGTPRSSMDGERFQEERTSKRPKVKDPPDDGGSPKQDRGLPPQDWDGEDRPPEKKKKKKKKKRDNAFDDGGLFHSASEPAGMGGARPPGGDEFDFGLGPPGGFGGPDEEGIGQRPKLRAGIRLEPLDPKSLPGVSHGGNSLSAPLMSSISVPTLP